MLSTPAGSDADNEGDEVPQGWLSKDGLCTSYRNNYVCPFVVTANLLLSALAGTNALAANGTALPGNSAKEVGMAGAGIAFALEPSALIRNPATGAAMGTSLDLNMAVVAPDGRYNGSATADSSQQGIFELSEGERRSAKGLFFIPSLAFNRRINQRWAWGLQVSGAGLGSELEGGTVRLGRGLLNFESNCRGAFGGGPPVAEDGSQAELCGNGKSVASIALSQVFVALSISFQAHERLSLGFAPLLAVQQFDVSGLAAFKPYSVSPEQVTDNGSDYSSGLGFRLGALLELHDNFHFGFGYQSATQQSRLEKYQGLLPAGRLDTPEILYAGVAIGITASHRLALDIEQLQYGDVTALSNSANLNNFANGCLLPRVLNNGIPLNGVLPVNLPLPNVPAGALASEATEFCFGGAESPGFGWKDVTVYKIGYQGEAGRLGWQLGYSKGGSPIGTETPVFNAIAPGHSDEHIAAGVSWKWSERLTVSSAVSQARFAQQRQRNGLSNAPVGAEMALGAPQLTVDVSQDSEDQLLQTSMEVWQWQLSMSWRFEGMP